MSKEFKTNEYHKGEDKFTEEGNLKDSKKEGLWKTYIHEEKRIIIGGYLEPGEERKIIPTNEYIKLLFKEENYVNGKLHGQYTSYYWMWEGKWIKEEGMYENGEKTGEWIHHGTWNDRSVFNYKNGKKHGLFKSYQQGWVTPKEHSTDILIEEGTYKDGKIHGNNKSYHFKKHQPLYLTDDLNYKNGKLHGYCKEYNIYPNPGRIKSEGMYKNDKRTGKWIYYSEWGNKCVDRICEYDHNEGEYPLKITSFRSDGKTLFSIDHWKDNKLHGLCTRYDSDGKLWIEETYKNGKTIDSKFYDCKYYDSKKY